MRILVIVACLGLAACNQHQQAMQPQGIKLSQLQEECHYESKPFIETWNCMRVGIPSIPVYPDIMGVFTATGDFAAEQVRSGKMSDAEAKLVMAKARQKAREDAELRDDLLFPQTAPQTVSRPAPVNSPMIFPPAPMPSYSPPATGWGSQPQIIYTPKGGIMCQQIGYGSVMCN